MEASRTRHAGRSKRKQRAGASSSGSVHLSAVPAYNSASERPEGSTVDASSCVVVGDAVSLDDDINYRLGRAHDSDSQRSVRGDDWTKATASVEDRLCAGGASVTDDGVSVETEEVVAEIGPVTVETDDMNVEADDTDVEPSAPTAPSAQWTSTSVDELCDSDSGVTTGCVAISQGPFCFERDSSVGDGTGGVVRPLSRAERRHYYDDAPVRACALLVDDFLRQHAQLENAGDDRLTCLLSTLLAACDGVALARRHLRRLNDEVRRSRAACWRLEQRCVDGAATCVDGRRLTARLSHDHAVLSSAALTELRRTLAVRRRHLADTVAPGVYTLQLSRLQLQQHLDGVWRSCQADACGGRDGEGEQRLRHCCAVLFEFQRRRSWRRDSRVADDAGGDQNDDQHDQDGDEAFFVRLTRGWLLRLAAELTRHDAGYTQHVYLLNEVLRCGSGMRHWALALVQMPVTARQQAVLLDYYLVALRLVVGAVEARGHFLLHASNTAAATVAQDGDDDWVLVDSEEYEAEKAERFVKLQEADVLALFGRVSWDVVMRVLVGLPATDDGTTYDVRRCSEHSALRLLAYAWHVVRLLLAGLKTYDSQQQQTHGHFCRVLCHSVVDVVRMVCEHWQRFVAVRVSVACRSRLQVEFDSLVCRTAAALVGSPHAGVWHFVSDLPFGHVSPRAAWRLLWLLHAPPPSTSPAACDEADDEALYEDDSGGMEERDDAEWAAVILSPTLHGQFQHQLVHMSQSHVYFRLAALAGMATARNASERAFIKTVTCVLMQVCFVAPTTRQLCSKAGRDLLSAVCSSHSFVMSHMMWLLQQHAAPLGSMTLYLASCLPLTRWRPASADVELVCAWLTEHAADTTQSRLARRVLERLDWGLQQFGRRLCLPAATHRRVAVAVVEAQACHATEPPLASLAACWGASTSSDEAGASEPASTRRALSMVAAGVSSLALTGDASAQAATAAAELRDWCWRQMSRLRLHCLDGDERSVRLACVEPSVGLADVPPLTDRRIASLHEPMYRQRQPLAVYGALLVSQLGHSVPQLCGNGGGLRCVAALADASRPHVAAHLLQLIVPLFVSTPHQLPVAVFEPVLTSLLAADSRCCGGGVRSLVVSAVPSPGAIMRQLAGVIQYHVSEHRQYGLETPAPFVRLWLRCLTGGDTSWQGDARLVYVINELLRAAFSYGDARRVAFDHLYDMLHTDATNAGDAIDAAAFGGGGLSSLLSWVTAAAGGALQPFVTAAAGGASSALHAPWLGWFVLAAETYAQRRSGLWCDLIGTMHEQPTTSVEQAVRVVCHQQRLPQMPVHSVAIYRWAQQLLDTPLECALLPELWRQFVSLYLARVVDADGRDCGSVGARLFANAACGAALWQRLLQHARATFEHWRHVAAAARSVECASHVAEVAVVARLMGTFCVWLEESRLTAAELCVHSLPATFETERLAVVCGVTDAGGEQELPEAVWVELVCGAHVRRLADAVRRQWTEQLRTLRSPVHRDPGGGAATDSAGDGVRRRSSNDRLERRLNAAGVSSSPCVVTPASCQTDVSPPPPLPESVFESQHAALELVDQHVRRLCEHGRCMEAAYDRLCRLDERLTERLLPELYANCNEQLVRRLTCDAPHCSGAAIVAVECAVARRNDAVNVHLEQDARTAADSQSTLVAAPAVSVVTAAVLLEALIDGVVHRRGRQTAGEIGVAAFYRLLESTSGRTTERSHIERVLAAHISTLGGCFISNTSGQCERLLHTMLARVELCPLLLPLLTPLAIVDRTQYVRVLQTALRQMTHAVCDGRVAADTAVALLRRFSVAERLCDDAGEDWCGWADLAATLTVCLCAPDKHARRQQTTPDAAATVSGEAAPLLAELSRHVTLLLCHDWRRLRGDILQRLLDASRERSLPVLAWFDVVNVLTDGDCQFHAGMGCTEWIAALNAAAAARAAVPADLLTVTCDALAERFQRERVEGGSPSLYAIYSDYLLPLASLLHVVTSHALLVTVGDRADSPPDMLLTERLWPLLCAVFEPWIFPLPAAAQTSDDQQLLLPWSESDSEAGRPQLLLASFVESTCLLHSAVSADAAVLSLAWQLYCDVWAQRTVTRHVTEPLHAWLLQLPWCDFRPRLGDVERMAGVLDGFLPDAHGFVAQLVVQLPWWPLPATTTADETRRLHTAVLCVLVKVASEPVVRQSGELFLLLSRAETQFDWPALDADGLQRALNWHVMSADVRCVLETEDREPVDVALLDMLRVASGLASASSSASSSSVAAAHTDGAEKRRLVVRAVVRLMCGAAFKHKQLVCRQPHGFMRTMRSLLDDVRRLAVTSAATAASEEGPRGELLMLVCEVLGCCSAQAPESLVRVCCACVLEWLADLTDVNCSCAADVAMVHALLGAGGRVLHSPSQLAALAEAALDWLMLRGALTWRQAAASLPVPDALIAAVTDAAVAECRPLVLHVLLLQRLDGRMTCGCSGGGGGDAETMDGACAVLAAVESCVEWMTRAAAPGARRQEAAVCALLHRCLTLLVSCVWRHERRVAELAVALAGRLVAWSGSSRTARLLAAIGLGPRTTTATLSDEFRVLCRVVCAALVTHVSLEMRVHMTPSRGGAARWPVGASSGNAVGDGGGSKCGLPDGLVPQAYEALEQLMALRSSVDAACLQMVEEAVADTLSACSVFGACPQVMADCVRAAGLTHGCLCDVLQSSSAQCGQQDSRTGAESAVIV